jgi:hypothetical protein
MPLSITRPRIRQAVLVISALVFTGIAIGSLVAPKQMAAQLGYSLLSTDAYSEFRAVYIGVWLATAVLLVVAARHIGLSLIADLGALLILGQTAGRLISIILDGFPSLNVWPIALLELLGGLAILLSRPNNIKFFR